MKRLAVITLLFGTLVVGLSGCGGGGGGNAAPPCSNYANGYGGYQPVYGPSYPGAYNQPTQYRDAYGNVVGCTPAPGYWPGYAGGYGAGVNYGSNFYPPNGQGNCAAYGPTSYAVSLPGGLACTTPTYFNPVAYNIPPAYYAGATPVYQTCMMGASCACRGMGSLGISVGMPGLAVGAGFCF